MYFDHKIFKLNVDMKNREEILNFLSEEFLRQGMVTREFAKAITEREKTYPTGLQVGDVGIALPHADRCFVKESQIGIATLKTPVDFCEMGTEDVPVKVSIVVMLALHDADEHIEILQKLIELFQNEKFVSGLGASRTEQDVVKILKEFNL